MRRICGRPARGRFRADDEALRAGLHRRACRAIRASRQVAWRGNSGSAEKILRSGSVGTGPADVIRKVDADVRAIVGDPDFRTKFLERFAVEPVPGPRDVYTEYLLRRSGVT
jgi:hypothetical protein